MKKRLNTSVNFKPQKPLNFGVARVTCASVYRNKLEEQKANLEKTYYVTSEIEEQDGRIGITYEARLSVGINRKTPEIFGYFAENDKERLKTALNAESRKAKKIREIKDEKTGTPIFTVDEDINRDRMLIARKI